jgi:hypothetical protein
MPSESSIVTAIKRRATVAGWWVMKHHGSAYSLAGLPDLVMHKGGVTVYMEVKRPGEKPTPIQVRRMAELRERGGVPAVVVTSVEQAASVMHLYDPCCKGHSPVKTPRRGVECRKARP